MKRNDCLLVSPVRRLPVVADSIFWKGVMSGGSPLLASSVFDSIFRMLSLSLGSNPSCCCPCGLSARAVAISGAASFAREACPRNSSRRHARRASLGRRRSLSGPSNLEMWLSAQSPRCCTMQRQQLEELRRRSSNNLPPGIGFEVPKEIRLASRSLDGGCPSCRARAQAPLSLLDDVSPTSSIASPVSPRRDSGHRPPLQGLV